MGSEILTFYHEKLKKEWKLAFYSAFTIGFLVHIYKFTNILLNWDALHNFYNSQNMVATGRWFLTVACGFSSWFDLPWINGMLSLVFMGIAAAMVAEVFRMKNSCLIVLSSGLLVSFPAVTATMFYEYTADGYMMAMALAAFSVVLSRMEYIGKTHWKRLVLSSVCICLACGIYQAYLSFAFVLAVCYFITELLENRWEKEQYWKWIGAQIVIYIAAMASYYLIWKLCLNLQGYATSTYQGISDIGTMGIGTLPGVLAKILVEFSLFFLEWNIFENGITVYSGLNILFLTAFAIGTVAAIVRSGCHKRISHLILLLLCLAALPVGCYICYLTSPSVFYHTLMVQSICLLYILTAVVYDRWIKATYGNLVLVLLMAIIFNNSVAANAGYTLMDQSMKRTEAAAAEISTRIHLLDDGTIRYVAIYGGLADWDEDAQYVGGELRELGAWKAVDRSLMSPMFLSLFTDFELSYYRSQNLKYPVMEFGPELPAPRDWEFRFPALGLEEQQALAQTEAVQNMPVWPHRDSVQVIGDTIVVKLSEN